MTTRLFSIIATHPLGGILRGLDSSLGAVIAGISINNVLRVNGRPVPKSSNTDEDEGSDFARTTHRPGIARMKIARGRSRKLVSQA